MRAVAPAPTMRSRLRARRGSLQPAAMIRASSRSDPATRHGGVQSLGHRQPAFRAHPSGPRRPRYDAERRCRSDTITRIAMPSTTTALDRRDLEPLCKCPPRHVKQGCTRTCQVSCRGHGATKRVPRRDGRVLRNAVHHRPRHRPPVDRSPDAAEDCDAERTSELGARLRDSRRPRRPAPVGLRR